MYSVSAVNQHIKALMEADYGLNHIYVKGEISNCKYHYSGHIYFTLKDRTSSIACVMFSSYNRNLKFRLTEGMQVIVLGSIGVYERDGKYQLYAQDILQDGMGRLYEQFEFLKKRLSSEGLFDEEHKKALPFYPKKLGIVTASTGAAIQDMINVSTRRNPYIQLVFCAAKVQGEGAAKTIAAGIKALDQYGVDVIIVGRGGGSIEDLWAFNEELVARAIYACETPIISAVGHETDWTIADYVADMRAPTPSAAAELAVPSMAALLQKLDEYEYRLYEGIQGNLNHYRQRLAHMEKLIHLLSPEQVLATKRQDVIRLEERLQELMRRKIEQERYRLNMDIQRLKGASPLDKLGGGYAFVAKEGEPVRSVKQVAQGDEITVSLKDGVITAQIQGIDDKGV